MLNKVISVKSTVYPFDYNKNNPLNDEDFNNWTYYISKEVSKVCTNCENVLIQAKKILNSNLKIK